jgi:hypothetical protein
VIRGRGAGYLAAASVLTQSLAALAAGAPPIVRVYVAGSSEAVSGSRDAIQDLCSRANVAVVVRDAAGADEALLATSRAPGLAQAYVDLRAGTPPRVVVVDSESGQDLERRTLPEGASLEISIETMAHVVCAAVESSLAAKAGAPAPVIPAAKQQPVEREPEKPPDAEQRWQARASLFASGANFGAGFRAGAGAALGVNHGQARWHFGAFLSLSGYPAAGVQGSDGLASFGLLGVRVVPLLEWQATETVTAFAGIGAGGDWIRISGERPPPGAISSATASVWEPMASGMLGVRLLLGRSVSALIALDADVALARHRYVVQTAEGTETFFQPSRVRPMALAGLSLSFGNASEPKRPVSEARR